MEEVILIDGQKLNEVILPLMNVSRRTTCGKVDPNEILNKSQTYITTAGLNLAPIIKIIVKSFQIAGKPVFW
nr:MAG TPA: terminase large subunit [Caudoviricetes sp.]